MHTIENTTDYYHKTLKVEGIGAYLPNFLVGGFIERARLHILEDMLGAYGAPSDSESGWISRLLPIAREWNRNSIFPYIQSLLTTFFNQQTNISPKQIFIDGEISAFDLFRTCAHFGGENGPIVRYVTDRKVSQETRDYRINQVVEALSIAILIGIRDVFVHSRNDTAKSIFDSLNRLKDQADQSRQELVEIVIELSESPAFYTV